MGCDIHLFAEAKKSRNFIDKILMRPAKWELIFDEDELYGSRNYNLFSALCGVRSGSFYGSPPRISPPRGIPNDVCGEIAHQVCEWAGDGHSHNYNTLRELKEFDWSEYGETVGEFTDEVIPKLEALNLGDENVRIVYFFDN